MKFSRTTIVLGAFLLAAPAVYAQRASLAATWGMIVFPSENQNAEQQSADESACLAWGKENTGVDPANPMAGVATAARPAQGGEGLGAASGAIRGASRAALIGNLADKDGGDWALGGALLGSVRGAREREEQNQRAQQQAEAQRQAQSQERLDTFKRAFSVCMQAKNYAIG